MRALILRRVCDVQIVVTLAVGWLTTWSKRRRDRPFDIERARRVWRAFPEPKRSAVYLHVDHGLTYHEVARELGISAGQALRLITKGFAELREKLNMEHDEFALTVQTPPPMTAALPIRIFQISDTEWWAGATMDEVLADAARAWGFDIDSDDYRMMREEAIELTDASMARLQYSYDEDNPALKRSFRDELDLRLADPTNTFPQFFAGVE